MPSSGPFWSLVKHTLDLLTVIFFGLFSMPSVFHSFYCFYLFIVLSSLYYSAFSDISPSPCILYSGFSNLLVNQYIVFNFCHCIFMLLNFTLCPKRFGFVFLSLSTWITVVLASVSSNFIVWTHCVHFYCRLCWLLFIVSCILETWLYLIVCWTLYLKTLFVNIVWGLECYLSPEGIFFCLCWMPVVHTRVLWI